MFDYRQAEGELQRVFQKYSKNVGGLCVSIIHDDERGNDDNKYIKDFALGYAVCSPSEEVAMTTSHFMQCASLSKTVCAAFSIEYFANKRIDMEKTSVNALLDDIGAKWRLHSVHPSTMNPNEVNLNMLLNHTALGMHYVWGIPLTDPMPSPLSLLDGSSAEKYGYQKLLLERKAGQTFSYSGGGFVVMQYIIEEMENDSLQNVTRAFLNECGLIDFTFSQADCEIVDAQFATGTIIPFKQVVSPPLAFPPFAAGGLCTSRALSKFLYRLMKAYQTPGYSNGISHTTARKMLGESTLLDLGSLDFIGAKIGLGVFVAAAGRNKFMLHQAANDGFRGVYCLCFEGPDEGKGCIILANGDNPAVLLQCEVLRLILGEKILNMSGIDFSRYNDSDLNFDTKNVKQEAIVNKGLKDLVTFAFESEWSKTLVKSKL